MLEVTGNKIMSVVKSDAWIDSLVMHNPQTRLFRIEQVPDEQEQVKTSQMQFVGRLTKLFCIKVVFKFELLNSFISFIHT